MKCCMNVQLMWRMLDYVTRKNGCKPFAGNKNLRAVVLAHLCSVIGVTEIKIQNEESSILAQEIVENNKAIISIFHSNVYLKRWKTK